MIDEAKLLIWLDERAAEKDTSGRTVQAAIYAGLADRVRRGDFN